MALPAAPWPSITPWLKTPPTRYQTSVLGSRSRTFSAKVFNGAAAALFGAACFLAAFFGFLPGADIFFAGFVAALFVGFVDAVVRDLDFFFAFVFFDAMLHLRAE